MEYRQLEIEGVWEIVPHRWPDARGYFAETFKLEEFERRVGRVCFVQDNESVSQRGVVRGLHFQRGEWAQAKLVRVSQGRVLDVAVDLRQGSATFGRHVAVELSADEGNMLFIPRGFAHGFAVLSPVAQFQYKVDNAYAPQAECTLLFSDPALGIEWPFAPGEMLLSEKDRKGQPLNILKNSLF